ncbi:MAG TPA: alanine racemase [Gemmatimonadales bacterium]|nr:alanine racemase [Gemmatimonadales bacterium]
MSIPADTARAWVDVDLAALLANASTVARASGTRLLPMVKANGYGLGAVPVARALEAVDPWGFGVACVEEGIELRAAGITRPIVAFTPLTRDRIPLHLEHDVRPAIGDVDTLAAWLAASDRPFHLEIDTGMGRAGVRWHDAEALAAAAALVASAPGWEGLFTHFHSADGDEAATLAQRRRFEDVVRRLPRRPALVHAANSAAALRGIAGGDLARPGIFLYGGAAGGRRAEPVARLRARVVAVRRVRAGDTVSYDATWRASRDTTIATLGIGYADGVPRSLSCRGRVELRGRVVGIVGRVTMDMTMIDAGDLPVVPGDVATIVGGAVSLDEQAGLAGTIAYELLTSLGRRVERRYHAAP